MTITQITKCESSFHDGYFMPGKLVVYEYVGFIEVIDKWLSENIENVNGLEQGWIKSSPYCYFFRREEDMVKFKLKFC